jgi:hypothetical protein
MSGPLVIVRRTEPPGSRAADRLRLSSHGAFSKSASDLVT